MKYWLACVFLCSTYWARATEPGAADSLFAAGNYQRAALEYERIFFTDTSVSGKAMALLKRSSCFKQQNNFPEAYTTLKRVRFDRLGDSLAEVIWQERALCAYLSADYENAEYELQQLNFFIKDARFSRKGMFLEVLVKSELEKWAEVKELLEEYLAYKGVRADTMNLDALVTPRHLRNVHTAKVLSLMVPGLGQAYAGRPGRALASLLLQGGAVAFGVISILQGYYVEGIFTGASLFLRFYTGGARHAQYLARQHNQRCEDAVKQKIKALVLKCEALP